VIVALIAIVLSIWLVTAAAFSLLLGKIIKQRDEEGWR